MLAHCGLFIKDLQSSVHLMTSTVLSFVYSGCEFVNDLINYWQPKIMQYIFKPSEKSILHQQLWECNSFHEWHDVALRLDHLQSNDIWRANPQSNDYDYKLISSLALRLDQLRSQKRYDELTEVIRSGLVRNIGSICSAEMFSRAYAGTKVLIESYINSVVRSLQVLSQQEKAENNSFQFFKDARQSYGRTALVLHGGSLFGMCHLGVIKSLLYANLLPEVICGSTIGAIVAAYICSVPHHKIEYAINQIPTRLMASFTPPQQQQQSQDEFDTNSDESSSESEGSKYLSHNGELLARTLFTPEIVWFHQFVHDHLGDMTFEEAFAKSKRKLNILVLEEGSEAGTFYNYLTTPKVVVRTAILASIGSGMLPNYQSFDIHIQDYQGNIVKKPHSSKQRFLPANHKTYVPPRESPYTRLAELFNVNNYVVSITRPYFAPFLLSDSKYRGQPKLWRRVISLASVSTQYRIGQLAEWGIISPWLKSIFIDEMIPKGFQVNIVPESDSLIHDVLLALDTVNIWQKVKKWIDLGERSVWPNMSLIWARTKIEYTLDEICQRDA